MALPRHIEAQLFWPCRCMLCSTTLPSSELLGEHYKDDHPQDCCQFCKMIFDSPSNAKRHRDNFHHPCPKCTGYFSTRENLKTHFTYSGDHAEDYCYICDMLFSTRDEWWNHMTRNHIFCQFCYRTYWKPEYLRQHIAERHSSEQPQPSPKHDQHEPNMNINVIHDANMTHYQILGLSPSSSHQDILRVARQQRIACHPDRLLQQEGLSAEEIREIQVRAQRVGQAADVLSDPVLRAKYDSERR